jgi:hypothetical protein
MSLYVDVGDGVNACMRGPVPALEVEAIEWFQLAGYRVRYAGLMLVGTGNRAVEPCDGGHLSSSPLSREHVISFLFGFMPVNRGYL